MKIRSVIVVLGLSRAIVQAQASACAVGGGASTGMTTNFTMLCD